MAKAGQRKCMSCGEFFLPDPRSGERQRFCAAGACRRASKAASQAAWLARPANKDYFRGPVHVARVQAWRTAHPGYGRGKARPLPALQDDMVSTTRRLVQLGRDLINGGRGEGSQAGSVARAATPKSPSSSVGLTTRSSSSTSSTAAIRVPPRCTCS